MFVDGTHLIMSFILSRLEFFLRLHISLRCVILEQIMKDDGLCSIYFATVVHAVSNYMKRNQHYRFFVVARIVGRQPSGELKMELSCHLHSQKPFI